MRVWDSLLLFDGRGKLQDGCNCFMSKEKQVVRAAHSADIRLRAENRWLFSELLVEPLVQPDRVFQARTEVAII